MARLFGKLKVDGQECIGLVVEDDSLEPVFHNGDGLIFRPGAADQIPDGMIVAVVGSAGGVLVGRVYRQGDAFCLTSINGAELEQGGVLQEGQSIQPILAVMSHRELSPQLKRIGQLVPIVDGELDIDAPLPLAGDGGSGEAVRHGV